MLFPLILVAGLSVAQAEPTPPPLVPDVVVPANAPLPPEPAYVQPSYAERCFAVPAQAWIPGPTPGYYYRIGASSSAPLSTYHAAQPADAPTTASSPSSSGGTSGGGGGIDGKAVLVLAVVLVAALPIVVYVIDDDAPAVVEQRFHCPTFGVDLVGGVDLADRVSPAGSARLTFGYSYFGADFQFDFSSGSASAWAGHLMLRIGPKSHIEPNLAFGGRSVRYLGQTHTGFEVGVPHRYVFWREGLRAVSLELRPTLMFGYGGFDVGLEGAMLIPLVEPIHLRVGGKVQSFGEAIIGGVNAGLSVVY